MRLIGFTGLTVLAALLTSAHGQVAHKTQNLGFQDFLYEIERGAVRDVAINGRSVTGHFTDGVPFRMTSPEGVKMAEIVAKYNPTVLQHDKE